MIKGPSRQMGVRWNAQKLAKWTELAARWPFHQSASGLAKLVLEEFMSCFLSEDELKKLGMAQAISEPPRYLIMAVRQVEKSRSISDELRREAETMARLGYDKFSGPKKAR
jgi:hypothetical protein